MLLLTYNLSYISTRCGYPAPPLIIPLYEHNLYPATLNPAVPVLIGLSTDPSLKDSYHSAASCGRD